MILTLPFLAQRDYLHGTTLFDALAARFDARGPLSLKIGQVICTDRVRVEAARPGSPAPAATFTIADPDGVRETLNVYPVDASDRIERQAYDEDAVTRRARFEPGAARVTLDEPSPVSLIATLIPLNKLLLSRMPATAGIGQWLFARIDLTDRPSTFPPISLQFGGSLSGGRIACSRIQAGALELGNLYFSQTKRGS